MNEIPKLTSLRTPYKELEEDLSEIYRFNPNKENEVGRKRNYNPDTQLRSEDMSDDTKEAVSTTVSNVVLSRLQSFLSFALKHHSDYQGDFSMDSCLQYIEGSKVYNLKTEQLSRTTSFSIEFRRDNTMLCSTTIDLEKLLLEQLKNYIMK